VPASRQGRVVMTRLTLSRQALPQVAEARYSRHAKACLHAEGSRQGRTLDPDTAGRPKPGSARQTHAPPISAIGSLGLTSTDLTLDSADDHPLWALPEQPDRIPQLG
jgi:hypothetical protein